MTFLEGDPDRPLVISCLFYREHPVLYELSVHEIHSVLESLNSPDGGGCNELCVGDRKDQEQIFVYARRDWDEDIKHDQKARIGHQRRDTVEANGYSESKVEEHRTTHVERKMEVRTSDYPTVTNDQHPKTTSGQFVEASREIYLSSGLKMVLGVGTGLTFRGSGSFLRFDASGVTLSGANARISPGSGPGSGSGTALLSPRPPLNVDAATVGRVLDNPARSRSERRELEQLIVDVWGNPA